MSYSITNKYCIFVGFSGNGRPCQVYTCPASHISLSSLVSQSFVCL